MKRKTEDNLIAASVIVTYVIVIALSVAWVGFLVWAGITLVNWLVTL